MAARNLDFDSASNASTGTTSATEDASSTHGPTTRKQWTELVTKSESAAETSAHASSAEEEEESENVR